MTPATATMDWVRDFVLKHALCPFAFRPYEEGRVAAVSCPDVEEEEAFFWALTQVQGFADQQSEVATILLVFPEVLADFSTFLDFVYTFERALADTGADALVQLAHFHPNYVFAGVAAEDPGNRTNRAPYPVVQLLRVDAMAAAIAAYPDVEEIPVRNVEKMRKLFSA
ncbi:MAG: DUF1415 family protein [Bacteroidota bacterium]